jgi:hypothetical protein
MLSGVKTGQEKTAVLTKVGTARYTATGTIKQAFRGIG